MGIAYIGLTLAVPIFVIAGMYLVRASRYNRATDLYNRAVNAYLSHDWETAETFKRRARAASRRADRTFRWLP